MRTCLSVQRSIPLVNNEIITERMEVVIRPDFTYHGGEVQLRSE